MKILTLALFIAFAINCNGQNKKQISSNDDWQNFRNELQTFVNLTFKFSTTIAEYFETTDSDLPIVMEMATNSESIADDENTIKDVGVTVPSLINGQSIK